MKLRNAVRLAVVGLTVGMLAGVAVAAPKDPGKIEKLLQLAPEGLSWGITLEAVAKSYSDYYDQAYLKLYRSTEPGPELEALDAEVSDKKQLIKRNLIVFGSTPTGMDNTAMKGEYSYGNGESLSRVILGPKLTRNFFFFNNKLWKVYDEYDVTGGGPLGSNFEEAVNILKEMFGAEPQRLAEDYAIGRSYPEARWKTSTTLIRAVGRDPIIGIVYSSLSVEQDLPNRRKNRPVDPQAIDSDVKSVTKGR